MIKKIIRKMNSIKNKSANDFEKGKYKVARK